MYILALDTALTACSVALLDAESDTIVAGDSVFMDRGHAEALVPMVEQVMQTARIPHLRVGRREEAAE